MSKVAKAALGLVTVTIISKVLGFVRELVLGSIYGATVYSDAYITATNIPMTLFALIGVAISTTFIPLYCENRDIGGDEKAIKFTNNIINIVLILGTILALAGVIFAEPLVKIFAIGYEGEKFKLTVQFTRIMILGGLFVIISNIMSSFLQIKDNFIIPGLIGIPFSIIVIISIILSNKVNIYILPIGTLVGMFSQILFQYPFAFKKGYSYKLNLDTTDENMKKIIWLVAPVFIGVAVNQINGMVDRTLASTLSDGIVSSLNYANRLNSFVMALFITTTGIIIYPMLSKLSADDDKGQFVEAVSKGVNIVILLVLPISVGAIVLANPIVKLLFERGAFDATATNMTVTALIFYSIGTVAIGLRDILGKVFYSLQDTKTPMINGVVSMLFNIILNLILIRYMGHAGLAFATSISAIMCIILLFISLKKKIGYFGQDKIISVCVKSLISAILMGIVTYLLHKSLTILLGIGFINEIIALFVSVLMGAIIYTIFILIMKVEEINIIYNLVKNKVKLRESKL